jgi:hypothetical protein
MGEKVFLILQGLPGHKDPLVHKGQRVIPAQLARSVLLARRGLPVHKDLLV